MAKWPSSVATGDCSRGRSTRRDCAAWAEVDRAVVNAERAVAVGAARLAKIDADRAVLEAEIDGIVHEMRQLRQRYPRLLDAEEERLKEELAALIAEGAEGLAGAAGADQREEVASIRAELATIAEERAALPDDPAAIAAPVAEWFAWAINK